jgi:hypothetical protein
VDWRVANSAVILPLVRTLIDCFYNISVIFQNPGEVGYLFRASGYRRTLESLDADERRYGVIPDGKTTSFSAANSSTSTCVRTGSRKWRSESKALANFQWLSRARERRASNATPTFLKEFTYGFWQEYSAISHATFQGLLPITLFLAPKDLPHEDGVKIEPASEQMIGIPIARVTGVLARTLTEIQRR